MKDTSVSEIKSVLLRNTRLVVNLASDVGSYYDSRIEDINDKHIYISMPMRKGYPVQVVKGTKINVSALVATGRMTFISHIVNVMKEPIYMLVIEKPTELRHEQLRQFYRVLAHLRVQIFLGNLDKMKTYERDVNGIPYETGLVDDISGGGCRVSTSMDLHEGDMVVLSFNDAALDSVDRVECRVVRVSIRDNGKKVASLRYWGIDELMRDQIVRYVFRRQMELRKMNME